MNNRQIFLAGTIAGLAAVMAFAALFSALESSASAQMMQHQGMNMGSGMVATTGTTQSYGGMFSGSGSSVVSNVELTGVSITGSDEVSVSLRYTGTGAAPGVAIVANTNPTTMMNMMHGTTASSGMMGGMGMMGHGSTMGGMQGVGAMSTVSAYPAWSNAQWQEWHTQMAHYLALSNSTQWEQWHTQMMASPVWTNSTAIPYASNMQVGSNAVDAGWKNGSFEVKLEGAGSAYDSRHIMVSVFPLTS